MSRERRATLGKSRLGVLTGTGTCGFGDTLHAGNPLLRTPLQAHEMCSNLSVYNAGMEIHTGKPGFVIIWIS